MTSFEPFAVPDEQAGVTLAALLRQLVPELSWTRARRLVETRYVKLDGEICLDPARRLRAGIVVEMLEKPAVPLRQHEPLVLRYLDVHVVVVEKPSGVSTVRHPAERSWNARRKALHPTLEDLVPGLIARTEGRRQKGPLPRLRAVHRLDKDTSGLIVFARTVIGERGLGEQFRAHTVTRRYFAVVPGMFNIQRVATRLVRDRGDGRRGSTDLAEVGKDAVTHFEVVEQLPGYTLLGCRLETGRTHQIRIHLAERGHPICGDRVYHIKPDGSVRPDLSRAPRLALHAAELGFIHPVTNAELHWTMPLPPDLHLFLNRIRSAGGKPLAREHDDDDPDQVDR
jgi:23S rRNA pseudouridine1911/1915/1917 synthase